MTTNNKYHDLPYLDLVKNILANGRTKCDRTGTGTISLPFQQMRFDIQDGSLPLLTTKKVYYTSIIKELLWFLRGETNTNTLEARIWDEWANPEGELGPIYGAMWRNWPNADGTTVDQIANCIDLLNTNPTDRRIIVNSWNPSLLPDASKSFDKNIAEGKQALPPCHTMFQFWSDGENLSCHLYQRSVDVFLGLPFNICQYSMLVHMVALVTGLKSESFVWTGGDCHIYNNHIDQVNEQLTRTPYTSPYLQFPTRTIDTIDDFTKEDFEIINYIHHPHIPADIAI